MAEKHLGLRSGPAYFSSRRMREWLALALLTALVCAVFSKTIFFGQPISHAYMLGNRDLLFREFSSQVFQDYDETCYLLAVPSNFLVADYFRNFEPPLWNAFTGWGQPLLGDFSLNVLSPLRFLFSINPCLRFYNIVLIVPVLIGCIGFYLLSRSLRISRTGSIFAAISYVMCPFFLFYGEMQSGASYYFSPFVLWLFVRLANRLILSRALAAGLASGIFILAGHPEICFLGIMYGSLLLLSMSGRKPFVPSAAKGVYLARSSLLLVFAGITAFTICCTPLLEFIKYVTHGCSYKFTSAPSVIPWQAVSLNLIQPVYGGVSPFVGSCALPLVGVALLHSSHRKHALKILCFLLVFFLFLGTRPGNLAELFQNTPVNYIPGTYCVPYILTSVVILAAFGLDVLAKQSNNRSVFITYACGCLFSLCIPPILQLVGFDFKCCDFEAALRTGSVFDWKVWLVNLVVLVLPIGIFLFLKNKVAYYWLICCSVIIGGFVSQALVAKYSWPVTPPFEFKENDPVPFLKKLKARIGVIGYDVLSANDNTVFKIPSVSANSPLVLSRYQNFMNFIDSGEVEFATSRMFNTILKNNVMSKAFDIAAVPYVVSLLPVRDQGDPVVYEENDFGGQPVVFADGNVRLEMTKALLKYDQPASCVIGTVNWLIPRSANTKLICNSIVCDQKGNPFWFGSTQVIDAGVGATSDSQVAVTTNVDAIVPLNLPESQKFEVRVQLRDASKNTVINTVTGMPSALLGNYQKNNAKPRGKAHYEPIYESKPHFIRVYKNNHAVPRAYVVHEVEQVATAEQSLSKLAEKSFDPHAKVIIEAKTQIDSLNFPAEANSSPIEERAAIVIDRPNQVSLLIETLSPGVLVLTDTYYPGWECSIDGQNTDIFCANYAFRGVRLPAGKHEVVFCYRPLSLKIGIFLMVAFMVIVPTSVLLLRFRQTRKLQRPNC